MESVRGQVETRSVLVTDLVGSTELRIAMGEEAADSLRRDHDSTLGAVVAAHGGAVVRSLGDGIMATFESAADAVAASIAIQQAVHGSSFNVRVGLSTGDVSSEDGDVFGTPVVEASRLCAIANGGEILTADLVRALTRGRGGFTYEPMGDLELTGLSEPVPACRVLWEPAIRPAVTTAEIGSIPLADGLVGTTLVTGYVGRESLRGRLAEEWAAVAGGPACRTILLAGEPGVGKTRTAAELARVVHADGGVVLHGRCDEDLGVPYQPFLEALEHYVVHAGERAPLGRLPGELARLLPDLAQQVPDLPPPLSSEPAAEEHRLFEAIASWLTALASASQRGLLLVLDDIHWATKPTLLLLQHTVRTAAEVQAPVLILATYRDTDIDRTHPLAAAIADLRRLPGVDRLPVDNLTADEVVELMVSAAGHALPEDGLALARALHAETDGNPFFVGEVLRHLVETGAVRREDDRWVADDLDHLSVPEGVRDVVGRRLNRLSDTANDLLSIGAVIGRDFDVTLMLAVGDAAEDAVLDALDEAVAARLVEETGVDRFRFSHALVRTTLHEELSATRRRRLHRRVADIIEKVRPHDVVALSHHLVEGGPEGDMGRAVRYTLAAAEQALDSRAFGEAEVRFRRALELLEDDYLPVEEIVALCGLGESQRHQGDPAFRDTLLRAAWLAHAAGELELLTRAVLSNSRGTNSIVGKVDVDRVAVTEAALAAIGPEVSPTRVQLTANLAAELTFGDDVARRLRLADEAEALARTLGDPALLAMVLLRTSLAEVTASRTFQLVPRTVEMLELADQSGDPTLRVMARMVGSNAFVAAGDLARADATVEECRAIADAEGDPTQRWLARAVGVRPLAAKGHFEEALALNDEAINLANRTGQEDAVAFWASANVGVHLVRGGGDEFADIIPSYVEEYPGIYAWRCAHVFMLSRAGRPDEARTVIRDGGLDPVVALDDPVPLAGPFLLAMTAYELGDVELARRCRAALEPYRGCFAAYYTGIAGPIDQALAMTASLEGDHDTAVSLLEGAIEVMAAVGHAAWVTLLNFDLARALAARGDGDRAREVIGQVVAEATASGAEPLAARARAFFSLFADADHDS